MAIGSPLLLLLLCMLARVCFAVDRLFAHSTIYIYKSTFSKSSPYYFGFASFSLLFLNDFAALWIARSAIDYTSFVYAKQCCTPQWLHIWSRLSIRATEDRYVTYNNSSFTVSWTYRVYVHSTTHTHTEMVRLTENKVKRITLCKWNHPLLLVVVAVYKIIEII